MSIIKEHYNDEMQERGSYAIIPNEIWEIDCIDHTAKVIWCYLVSRKSDWKSSRNNVARNLKIGVNTATTYIGQLQSKNMIKITTGPQQSWDFEIVPPSGWNIPNLRNNVTPNQTGSNQIQIRDKATSESTADSVIDPLQIHTQEAISKTKLLPATINSKETKNIDLPEGANGDRMEIKSPSVPENTDSFTQINEGPLTTPPATQILRTWRSKSPGLSFVSGKAANQSLSNLFSTLKSNGCTKEAISNQEIIKCIFGSKPLNKFKNWIEDVQEQIETVREGVFSTIEIDNTTSIYPAELIDEKAIEIYKDLIARGLTIENLGMSLIEHANNQSYVQRFTSFNPKREI